MYVIKAECHSVCSHSTMHSRRQCFVDVKTPEKKKKNIINMTADLPEHISRFVATVDLITLYGAYIYIHNRFTIFPICSSNSSGSTHEFIAAAKLLLRSRMLMKRCRF